MTLKNHRKSSLTATFITALLALTTATAGVPAFASPNDPLDPLASESESDAPPSIPKSERREILGDDWKKLDDTAITSSGSATGFTILKSSSSTGYEWHALATLAVAGIDTDMWVGNSCVTSDGTKVAAVYGPRALSNDEQLFNEGAYAAIIDVRTGAITDLGRGYSLAYFNPGCGADGTVILSRATDTSTFLGEVNLDDGTPARTVEVPGQLTSPVVGPDDVIYAASPNGIVSVDSAGATTTELKTTGIAHSLVFDGDGKLGFIETANDLSTVKQTALDGTAKTLASGEADQIGLTSDTTGQVFISGEPSSVSKLPDSYQLLEASNSSTVSSKGKLAIEVPVPDLAGSGTESQALPTDVTINVQSVETGKDFTFHAEVLSAAPEEATPEAGTLGAISAALPMASVNNPVEDERVCAVARNDPRKQAYQPKPRQVEWAVNKVVTNTLTIARPANWKNLGMGAYSPQSMFPLGSLSGGGRIPSQILLGILAQESNLWQASRFTSPGQMGNPLIGNFYGTDTTLGSSNSSFWTPKFASADCGYGVGQITDGMRLAGKEKPGEVALSVPQQEAIALDYVANVTKAAQMLQGKWNETRAAGLTINNGNPSKIENWFFAVWAYNTGFYADQGNGSPWGVGWSNNPVNPNYWPGRSPFLDGHPEDASNPQNWPYPEKVMGFAAHSLTLVEKQTVDDRVEVAAFRTAWWNGDSTSGPANRAEVKPPLGLFWKTTVNECNPQVVSPCQRADKKCWWHGNATWKQSCDVTCGNELLRFTASYTTEQPDGESFPPNCTTNGLPPGSLIIDNLPLATNGTTVTKAPSRCAAIQSSGTFSLDFGTIATSNATNSYPSKIDLHQLGGGFNDHFYFTHTRTSDHPYASRILGTWRLGQSISQWARVYIHTPDHGAWSQQAVYSVSTANGTKTRMLPQRTYRNEWRSIGVFLFNGVPEISLSNVTKDGDGVDDIAWDAVAIQPLSAKPRDFIVAMGDSYSSGEGAPNTDGSPYSRESDNNGDWSSPSGSSGQAYTPEVAKNRFRNSCHRSSEAWSQKAKVSTNMALTIGQRAQTGEASLDYHFVACSGAESKHMMPGRLGRFRELSQLDQGYLDENTTLVTLTVGGNDIGFSSVLQTCLEKSVLSQGLCKDAPQADTFTTLQQATTAKINGLDLKIGPLLSAIQAKAPNAKILILGYPPIFQGGTTCALMNAGDQYWLNDMTIALNTKISTIASGANSITHPVIFADPTNGFYGRSMCASDNAINRVMPFAPGMEGLRSLGDDPLFIIPQMGEDWKFGVSQQSIHPNRNGTAIYANVMTSALQGRY